MALSVIGRRLSTINQRSGSGRSSRGGPGRLWALACLSPVRLAELGHVRPGVQVAGLRRAAICSCNEDEGSNGPLIGDREEAYRR